MSGTPPLCQPERGEVAVTKIAARGKGVETPSVSLSGPGKARANVQRENVCLSIVKLTPWRNHQKLIISPPPLPTPPDQAANI